MCDAGIGAVQMASEEDQCLGVFDVVEFLEVAVPAGAPTEAVPATETARNGR